MNQVLPEKLTLRDYTSDQEVRWCPGCGDYAILKTLQKLMPELEGRRQDRVFVSGIGCSSRFPYYMNTFGFHTIHGRAPAIATGVKLANPRLDVWVVTGDGDGLSIGGNHTMHLLRRNVDLQLLLFNNEIYGLTKGQYSPTSRLGTRSPSSPAGSMDAPLSPCLLALGAGGGFIARSIDTEAAHLSEVLRRGHAHRGTAFVEILQNCPIYNDGVFEEVKDKKKAADFRIEVRHGEPLLFGSSGGADKAPSKGLRLNPETLHLEVTTADAPDVLVHDETDATKARLLAAMTGPDFPIAVGVLYRQERLAFDESVHNQLQQIRQSTDNGHPQTIHDLLHSEPTWEVK